MICELIKSKLSCNSIVLFANKIYNNELNINDGIGTLNGYNGEIGDSIRICANNKFDCDDINLISSDLIFTTHILNTSNSFNLKYEYINLNIEVNIFNKINIVTISSETIAFEIFKNNPNNYIFIIPTVKKLNHYDNSNISLEQYYNILIYLYNKEDINNFIHINTINTIDTIENEIINILLNDNYKFINSEFVFNTQYTLIKKMEISNKINLDRYNNECYNLTLTNGNCV
jgi:hypothetical protein